MEDELEKAKEDMRYYGTAIMKDGKRIDPRDFYKKPTLWQRIKWGFRRTLKSKAFRRGFRDGFTCGPIFRYIQKVIKHDN